MFLVLFIFIFLKNSTCQVCRSNVVRVRDVPQTYQFSYYEAYEGTDCLIWCTKSRIVTKIGTRMVQKMFNESVDECCEGYIQDETNSINCQPTCDPPCENSVCQHPNKCVCHAKYVVDSNNTNICILEESNNNSNISNNNGDCPKTPPCKDLVINNSMEDTIIDKLIDDVDCPLRVKEQCCSNINIIKNVNESDNESIDVYSNDTYINISKGTAGENNNTNPNDTEIIVSDGNPFDEYEDSEPYCEVDCKNCKCIADDTWTCEPGWYFNENKTECHPHCDACIHGICKAPNICVCFEGYHLNETTGQCIADCNCTEGCLIPNICISNTRDKCKKCEKKCSSDNDTEERSKPNSNISNNKNFEQTVENITPHKTFKDNQSKTETKLSGIPMYWIYITAAICLLFLIIIIYLVMKKVVRKVGSTRKFSFVNSDKNDMAVHYSTTH